MFSISYHMFTTSKMEGITLLTDEANTNPEKRQIHSWFEGTSSSSQKFAMIMHESKNKARTLQTRTAEKWKTTSLAKYNIEAWLVVNENQLNTDLVAFFNCRICRKFEDQMSLIKGFNQTWTKEGSKRLLLNAAKEHVECEPHKKAFDLRFQDERLTMHECSERMHLNARGIVRGLDVMKQKDFELTKKMFETAYFVDKEELPIIKSTKILKLVEKHGVLLGEVYRNNMLGSMMIDFIVKWLEIVKFFQHLNGLLKRC